MKKLKFILSTIVLGLFIGNQTVAFASNCLSINKQIIQVNNLLSSHHKDMSINYQIPLYDENERIIAYGYSLQPIGYVIMDTAGYPVEYSFENPCPFTREDRVYYGGPLNYYIKETSQSYRHLMTREQISVSALQLSTSIFKDKEKTAQRNSEPLSLANTNSSYITYELPHATHTYSYNPDGRCGSVAAAIWLMYYDECLNDNTVPSDLVSSNGVTLINYLVPHIEGSDPEKGSSTEDVADGLNWYFQSRGLDQWFVADITYYATISSYIDVIEQNVPVIVDLNSHFLYGEHWVVGYGYSYSYTSQEIIVNDGWGHTGVYISMHYVGNIIY